MLAIFMVAWLGFHDEFRPVVEFFVFVFYSDTVIRLKSRPDVDADAGALSFLLDVVSQHSCTSISIVLDAVCCMCVISINL